MFKAALTRTCQRSLWKIEKGEAWNENNKLRIIKKKKNNINDIDPTEQHDDDGVMPFGVRFWVRRKIRAVVPAVITNPCKKPYSILSGQLGTGASLEKLPTSKDFNDTRV